MKADPHKIVDKNILAVIKGFCFLILSICCTIAYAQDIDTTGIFTISSPIQHKYISSINSKSTRLNQNIDKKTRQAVDKLKSQELGIAKKLMGKDSAAAKMLIKDVEAKYGQLDISASSQSVQKYIPELDSLSTSLAFLKQLPSATASSGLTTSSIATSIAQVDKLKSAFSSSSYAESFLKDRKQALKQLLTKYPLGKQLKRVNKQVYYYSQQAQSYREMLKDKKKIERKVLELLAKQKAFKQFMSKHSMLLVFSGCLT